MNIMNEVILLINIQVASHNDYYELPKTIWAFVIRGMEIPFYFRGTIFCRYLPNSLKE